jgi:SAM-dependent methyltransferase
MLSRRTLLISGVSALGKAQQKTGMFGDAEAYERFMGRWSRLLAPVLIEFAEIRDGWRVLDAGSGTGALAGELALRRPRCRIVGIDPSKEYVAYATARNAHANVRFEEGDAQLLSFMDGGFDASVSLLVFNFIPDARKALEELRRVTRAGGRIAAAVWDYGGGMQMLRIFWDAAAALDASAERLDEKHMPLCRAGELASLWKQGGLRRVEERPLEIATRFASFDDYWQPFLERQGPAGAYVAKLPAERQAALRERLRERLGSRSFELRARAWGVRGDVAE